MTQEKDLENAPMGAPHADDKEEAPGESTDIKSEENKASYLLLNVTEFLKKILDDAKNFDT